MGCTAWLHCDLGKLIYGHSALTEPPEQLQLSARHALYCQPCWQSQRIIFPKKFRQILCEIVLGKSSHIPLHGGRGDCYCFQCENAQCWAKTGWPTLENLASTCQFQCESSMKSTVIWIFYLPRLCKALATSPLIFNDILLYSSSMGINYNE